MILLALLLAAEPTGATATPATTVANPRAIELFEAEPALKAWAIKDHDANRDGWLTSFEASEAADAFRGLADVDKDGHVTVREFEAAKAFITSRLGLASN